MLLCGILSMFCLGVYDVLKNYEDNACEMTYMFELPEYMASSVFDISGCYRTITPERSGPPSTVVCHRIGDVQAVVLASLRLDFSLAQCQICVCEGLMWRYKRDVKIFGV